MAESIKKQDKVICSNCNGNGFTRIPYHLAKEEIWADCEECNSQGDVPGDKGKTHDRIK
tara:strand:- start:785 stop:961 length:177 start_codon:yes stop_codon:yes gene_type:complete